MPDARGDKFFVRRCYGCVRVRTGGEATCARSIVSRVVLEGEIKVRDVGRQMMSLMEEILTE